ncbi:hypothetical protein KJ853_02435 [Patescibacteria group bacterium]|nr:hypothetical protein [Patescibacteria group bacterium]
MPEQEILTKKEAMEFLGLDSKTFDNYFKHADEFKCLERPNGRGFFKFNKAELKKWQENYNWRNIELDLDDYALCLDFALAQHLRGYVMSDWGTGRQREFGQKITNWVKGQLAEIAVQKFFKKEFNCEVNLDFEIHENIVPQDIIGVKENSNFREPRIGVGIKSSKPKNAYLVLGENEVTLEERRSEIYIFCRPDIPDDHLLRLTKDKIIEAVKNKPHFDTYKNNIPSFENMYCEIAGYCSINELERVTSIPGQEFENGYRYVKKSGALHRSRQKWQELIDRL